MIAFGVTDKGKKRKNNQDAFDFRLMPEKGQAVLVLCDGMGGEKAGETASAEAVDAFLRYALERLDGETPELAELGREAAVYANGRVYDRAWREEACRGMGTTLVAALLREKETVIVNVGDSRGYWLSKGSLQQVTRDHSWVQEMVDQGVISPVEARSHPRKNLITRAIGSERRIRSDVFRVWLEEGDSLLLCSDGLSNLVTDEELTRILTEQPTPKESCEELLRLALERGAPDNVTVLVLQKENTARPASAEG